MSLPHLSQAFKSIREQCKRWKWREIKAEGELEELRMRLHQVSIGNSDVKATALKYLKAEAIAYESKLQGMTH